MDAVSSHQPLMPLVHVPIRYNLLIPVALLLVGAAVLPFDVQIASYFENNRLPSTLVDCLEICESFGHGFGATLIVIAVFVLDRPKLRTILLLFAGSLGSGVVANLAKTMIHRTRPRDFNLNQGTVWDTFSATGAANFSMHSMPSAHTATAFGLAMLLSMMYPQGRRYFLLLSILVGFQRIATRSHFPSDVFAGAAIGYVVGNICAASLRLPRSASIAQGL